ncbi:MAG TPA: Hpt domain-containing protein, partial [Ramlibacter sp.]
SESLTKLHPPSAPLAKSLSAAVDAVVRTGQAPRTEIAMEVATAVLYLEAAFQDLDPTDAQLPLRTARLAERLDQVRQGGQAQALEPWMEELYRRVSDRQTMGSVVGELRGTLSELEKVLDAFFRNPLDKAPLQNAPTHLLQMRGVLSVLGLDHATQAVARMRETLEQILVTDVEEEKARAAGTFEKLGNNLGALGFLIDMLNYQPTLAKKLFVYDDQTGELRPLMGRVGEAPAAPKAAAAAEEEISPTSNKYSKGDPTVKLSATVVKAAVAAMQPPAPPAPAPTAAPVVASAPVVIQEVDAELLEIFIEEAREVVGNGLAALEALVATPSDVGELTTLRRAFHTLKGSSRMVGLNEFGEAGWAMEQVLNTWLADQKPATEPLRTLSTEALRGFGRWIEDVAAKTGVEWKAAMFRGPADALRVEGRLVALALPQAGGAPAPTAVATPEPVVDLPAVEAVAELPALDLAPATPDPFATPATEPAPLELLTDPAPQPAPAADISFELPDFALATPASAPVEEVEDFQPSSLEMAQLDAALSAPAEPALDLLPDLMPEPAADPAPALVLATVAEPEVAELPADIDFDLAFGTSPAQPAAAPVIPPEITDIDFGSLAALSQPAAAPVAEPVQAPAPAPVVQVVAAAPAVEPVGGADEQVKVIGGLRIGIPLYNVYLNEADEWSRRLATEVAEWALELNRPMPDSAVGLAHALAGSSATVGFHVLSDIARTLEGALQHQQTLAYGTPQHGKAFVQAAEEIRRLLHQFAAGFLKDPDLDAVRDLQALAAIKLPSRADLADSGSGDLDEAPQQPAPAIRVQAPAPAPAPILRAPVAAPVVAVVPAHAASAAAMRVVDFAALPKTQPTFTVSGEGNDDDDLDVADAIDPDLFPIFEEEAVELMPQLGAALRAWSSGDRTGRDQVLRVLHTLKGSARLAGALRLGELAHRMESAAEHIGADSDAAHVEPLVQRFDQMQGRFDRLRDAANAPQPEFVPEPLAAAPVPTAAPVATPTAAPAIQAHVTPPAADIAKPTAAPVPRSTLVVPTAMHQPIVPRATGGAVRVRSQLLDRLMNQAGEVMITRSRLENELRTLRGSLSDLTGNLDRLRTQL